jgi:predicted RNase H-like HicB family nuclease
MKQFKVIVEKHPDGYVAYPLGLKGVVVGEGDTYEEALADVRSAIRFHIETFGQEVFEAESPVLEAFVAEAGVAPSDHAQVQEMRMAREVKYFPGRYTSMGDGSMLSVSV